MAGDFPSHSDGSIVSTVLCCTSSPSTGPAKMEDEDPYVIFGERACISISEDFLEVGEGIPIMRHDK